MSGAKPQELAQPILGVPAKSAIYLTVTVRAGSEQAVREGLADVPGLKRSVGFRVPETGLSCVTGIGSRFWDRAYADLPRPSGLHPFIALTGSVHTAVSTPGDVFFHLRASQPDMCFELARQLMLHFDGMVDVEAIVPGGEPFANVSSIIVNPLEASKFLPITFKVAVRDAIASGVRARRSCSRTSARRNRRDTAARARRCSTPESSGDSRAKNRSTGWPSIAPKEMGCSSRTTTSRLP